VYNKIGALGCTKSHIKALEEFEKNPKWKTCIIFEDDFTFRSDNKEENNTQLANCFQESWDIILLGYNALESQDIDNTNVKKVISAQTSSGYCVHKKFVHILKNNFKESEHSIESIGQVIHWNALDIYWKNIQPQHNWFTTIPSLGYQYSNYSDIEKKIVDYKR
jgi:GR25 family glycosyltransferase involved in LPS biosynthesis